MPKLLVTGFGPFSACSVNSSWLLAQSVRDRLAQTRPDLVVCAVEIPVEYSAVADKVPALWSTEQPDLVLHMGYYGNGRALRIERRARNAPYCKRDYCNKTCHEAMGQEICHKDAEPDAAYQCALDLDRAAEAVRREFPGGEVELVMSDDAGLYLCEFIYCVSLRRDAKRCVFVHVPDCVDNPAKQQLLTSGLCSLVSHLMRQLGL
ncbi:hypothetical protein BOX15_Mlig025324g4 [Macrostomum lignano]|nr:hypothetical protein BOX15_Mlig025324g4 [Macrostomum lignano]